MSEIFYNFTANNGSIENILGGVGKMVDLQGQIQVVFTQLQTVYGGKGSEALRDYASRIDGEMTETIDAMRIAQNEAGNQQQMMQALDQANAAEF
jgi:uncharacterized protein YukE